MMVLLPIGLLALAALALPVLIHLLRRSEQRVVDFAAWRYLSRYSLPRERLQLREWLLLALRLLLIATLALLISMPVWRDAGEAQSSWAVVVPGVDAARARAAVDGGDTQWHWLQRDFPSLEQPSGERVDFSLLRQLDAELPLQTPLIVVVPEKLVGLDAVRLQLRREVQWIVVPGGDAPTAAEAPRVAVRHDAQASSELVTVRALSAAWQAAGKPADFDIASQDVAVPDAAQLLIWLGGEPGVEALRWVERGGTMLRTRAPEGAWPPVESLRGKGRVLSLNTAFDAKATPALADAAQSSALRRSLLTPAVAPDRAYASSVAPVAGAADSIEPGKPLDAWLIVLAGLLFAAERIVAAWVTRPRHA